MLSMSRFGSMLVRSRNGGNRKQAELPSIQNSQKGGKETGRNRHTRKEAQDKRRTADKDVRGHPQIRNLWVGRKKEKLKKKDNLREEYTWEVSVTTGTVHRCVVTPGPMRNPELLGEKRNERKG